MYAIYCCGEPIALAKKPRYVKQNESGVFVEAVKEDAEAIAVNGTLYNLPGGTAAGDAPEAVAVEEDAEEFIFGNRVRIEQDSLTGNARISTVEDAVCDLDESTDERMSAIEDAICELDEMISGGGDN